MRGGGGGGGGGLGFIGTVFQIGQGCPDYSGQVSTPFSTTEAGYVLANAEHMAICIIAEKVPNYQSLSSANSLCACHPVMQLADQPPSGLP